MGLALLSLAACSPKPAEPVSIRNPGNLPADAYAPRGWTWSPVPNEAAPRRYGVASPPRVPRAEVLIFPEREPGEAWFPLVNALTARGYTVWLADPQPAPLRRAVAERMVGEVVRGGASGRILVLGQGRGAAAAIAAAVAGKARGVVLWSPVLRGPPIEVPPFEMLIVRTLHLGQIPVLNQPGWREGDPKGDPLAQAWMRANPALRPRTPTYASLYADYGPDMSWAAGRAPWLKGVPVRTTGGDVDANGLCYSLDDDCKQIAPGAEAMIAVFDKATEEVTLGAPPPPVGKKTLAPRATSSS